MLQRTLRRLLIPCAIVFLVATTAASAAPVSLEQSTLFVQYYPEEQREAASMVAYVSVPGEVPLPATIRIPIPEGADPFWVGEVFGSGVNDQVDEEREYEIVDGDGGPVVELTLEETRTAMYEALTGPADISGNRVSVSWRWVQSAPTKDVQFSVTLPAAAALVQMEPAPVVGPRPAPEGRLMLLLSPSRLQSGDTTTLAVSYSRAGVTLPDVEQPGGAISLRTVVLVALSVAAFALVFVLLREKSRGASDEADEGGDGDEPSGE